MHMSNWGGRQEVMSCLVFPDRAGASPACGGAGTACRAAGRTPSTATRHLAHHPASLQHKNVQDIAHHTLCAGKKMPVPIILFLFGNSEHFTCNANEQWSFHTGHTATLHPVHSCSSCVPGSSSSGPGSKGPPKPRTLLAPRCPSCTPPD